MRVSVAFRSFGHQMLAPGLLPPELRALPVRPQTAAAAWCAGVCTHTRSNRRRTCASVCAARARETPNRLPDVATREQLPVHGFQLPDGVRDGQQPLRPSGLD